MEIQRHSLSISFAAARASFNLKRSVSLQEVLVIAKEFGLEVRGESLNTSRIYGFKKDEIRIKTPFRHCVEEK